MKRGVLIFCLVLFLIFVMTSSVMAAKVAYIYRNDRSIDENVVSVLHDLGHEVDFIQEKRLDSIDSYDIIYVGDEKFRMKRDINVGSKPTIVTNYHHGTLWGITDRDGVSKMASNARLKVNKGGEVVEVYTQARDWRGLGLPYYYIADLNKVKNPSKVVGVYTGSLSYDFGDVITYFGEGSTLFNGNTAHNNICFFGIVASDYWTKAAKDMFKDCVIFVVDGIIEELPDMNDSEIPDMNDSEIPDMNDSEIPDMNDSEMMGKHDVGFINISGGVNMIKLEDANGIDIGMGEDLMCNTKYKISIKIKNKGNFSEGVLFNGSVGNLMFNHNTIPNDGNYLPGVVKEKVKTVNFTADIGEFLGDLKNYTIRVDAFIDGFEDDMPSDNYVEREVSVFCPVYVEANLIGGTKVN
jgi:hypothetical protein